VASTSSDSDDDGKSKVQSSEHHSCHNKLHVSIDDASETPGTSGKKRPPPKTSRKSNVSLPQSNQNLFEELEEIGEDMEMLDEVYENEHETPAMLKRKCKY
jgi:hypothetical protein